MPHVIVKLWPGKTEQQKKQLCDEIEQAVKSILACKAESVSIAFEEVTASDWKKHVYEPDILEQDDRLYKKPGYTM